MLKELVINAGSSTLKWKLFSMPDEQILASGLVDRIDLPASVFTAQQPGQEKYRITQDNITYDLAATMVLSYLKDQGNIFTKLAELVIALSLGVSILKILS